MSLTCFECVFGFYGAGFIFFTVNDEDFLAFQLIHYLLNPCCCACFDVTVVSAISGDEFFDQCVEGGGGNVGVGDDHGVRLSGNFSIFLTILNTIFLPFPAFRRFGNTQGIADDIHLVDCEDAARYI